MPKILQGSIDRLQEQVDITEVVSLNVTLKKQGSGMVGCCPFHHEKTPSFHVDPAKGLYYCFGCQKGGDAISYVRDVEGLSFQEAVQWLADRFRVDVEFEDSSPEEAQRYSFRQELYEILALAAKFYERHLRQPHGRDAVQYLLNQRKLKPETVARFQLGCAPTGWENLINYLSPRYPLESLEAAGLILPRDGGDGYYDRFRGRIMIPIHDHQGRVIGFAARAMGAEQPKYINSPQGELFDKGKILFGLDKARSAIGKEDRAVVVEGQFDVISLHDKGIENVVAAMGTALHASQVRQLLHYTPSKRVILNFDSDTAGTQATEKSLTELAAIASRGDLELHIVALPDGKDPDEYLSQHTPEDYRSLLDSAPLWLEWQVRAACREPIESASRTLQKLLQGQSSTVIGFYAHLASGLLSKGDANLSRSLEANLVRQIRGRSEASLQVVHSGTESLRQRTEANILRLYLSDDTLKERIRHALQRDGLRWYRDLWEAIVAGKATPEDYAFLLIGDLPKLSLELELHALEIDERRIQVQEAKDRIVADPSQLAANQETLLTQMRELRDTRLKRLSQPRQQW